MAKHIQMFFHCQQCINEMPIGESPSSYARYECGWTERGFQVWCNRHEINICHIDFEGMKHKADMTVSGDFDTGE